MLLRLVPSPGPEPLRPHLLIPSPGLEQQRPQRHNPLLRAGGLTALADPIPGPRAAAATSTRPASCGPDRIGCRMLRHCPRRGRHSTGCRRPDRRRCHSRTRHYAAQKIPFANDAKNLNGEEFRPFPRAQLSSGGSIEYLYKAYPIAIFQGLASRISAR